MTIEIERNCLVNELPVSRLQNALPEKIKQGFLIQGSDRKVKIRQYGKPFYLTEKQDASLLSNTGKPDNG